MMVCAGIGQMTPTRKSDRSDETAIELMDDLRAGA
jgi:hypothetical protein